MTRSFLSPSLLFPLTCWCASAAGGMWMASPAHAQLVASEVAASSSELGRSAPGTARQQAWLGATVEQRVRLAEQLGDDGARAFARAKGWTAVFDGTGRGLVQGPDQVYLGSDGMVHVLEAKGGSSRLSRAYGHPQGSTEWAVEAAKKVLRHPGASDAERRGAALILDAAARGKMQVHVVRTSHILGEPVAAVLEQTAKCSDEAVRLAQSALDDLTKGTSQVVDDVARSTDDVARATAKSGTRLRTVAKVAVPVVVAVDAGFRVRDGIETEQRFVAGEITVEQREVAHATNVAGMAGGWGGALAGAKLGTVGGGAAGTAVAPGPGTVIGGIAGGFAGGVAGYIGGEAAAEAAAAWTVNRVHAAGTTIADSAEAAWTGTVDAATSAAETVNRVWERVWGY